MSPRAKNRLLTLGVLAALVGAAAWALSREGPPELLPQVEAFFRAQDEDRALDPFRGSALHEHWDPPALRPAGDLRRRLFGTFVRIVDAPDPETFTEGGQEYRRLRVRVAFEKREGQAVFTFRRTGPAWFQTDFEMPLIDLSARPRREEHAKTAALAAARAFGEYRLDTVLEGLARAQRLPLSPDAWKSRASSVLEGAVTFQSAAPEAWTFEDGRGRLTARLTFASGERWVDLEVVFDPSEGRWVLSRFEPRR